MPQLSFSVFLSPFPSGESMWETHTTPVVFSASCGAHLPPNTQAADAAAAWSNPQKPKAIGADDIYDRPSITPERRGNMYTVREQTFHGGQSLDSAAAAEKQL